VWTEALNSTEFSPKSATSSPTVWPVALAGLLLIAGIASIVLSFSRYVAASGQVAWSQDEALQYQAAAVKLHGLSHQFVHESRQGNQQSVRAELDKAQTEYDALRTQLESAMNRSKYIARMLRVSGVLLMTGAALCLYLQPRSGRGPSRRASNLKPFHLYSQPQPADPDS
jgi:hypothetical protein